MTSNTESKPASYLADTLSAISPWGTPRSQTPKPSSEKDDDKKTIHTRKSSLQRKGGDHVVSHTRRLSLKKYPNDCPKLEVRWFHAVDVAKRKPNYVHATKDEKPVAPKKWSAFSLNDSKSIEAAFHRVCEEEEQYDRERLLSEDSIGDLGLGQENEPQSTAEQDVEKRRAESSARVPVNEDYLFDVDIRARELEPAYWLGPVYEVRRGTWFFIEGTTMKPCDENLATQLEEGYVKNKPWTNVAPKQTPDTQPTSGTATPETATKAPHLKVDEQTEVDGQKDSKQTKDAAASQQPLTHRLFGAYMNSVVTYQDTTTAWLLSDDFLSRMSGTMYQRFAGGAHYSGTKVMRGYADLSKKKPEAKPKRKSSFSSKDDTNTSNDANDKAARRRSAPPAAATRDTDDPEASGAEDASDSDNRAAAAPESRMKTLERQMSNLVASNEMGSVEGQDEKARKREEKEIRDDYRDDPDEDQGREIEHLILITHGIGQRLGARFETFNFIHDVNQLRKTLKAVYKASPDLQALNSEVDKLPKNCRVQVLPITWRHLLDFPMQGVKYNKKEHDITDVGTEDDEPYPELEAITVEGVPALRNMISDLALDILLYQTPAYKDHISKIVIKECNRILKLFKERNPSFTGKVSLIGHSLGSAIMFDVLCDQPKQEDPYNKAKNRKHLDHIDMQLNFGVENLFCFGSPIGLFQMLKGKHISARRNPNKVTLDGSADAIEDPFQDTPYSKLPSSRQIDSQQEAMASTPNCEQLFNIFHPTDPISYRMEPLISSAMAGLKPQPLPYTKKNFFGAPMGQGITGIPAKVGQSFSGFWSNFSSGIATSFINKSLGLTAEDAAKLSAPSPAAVQAQIQGSQIQSLPRSRSQSRGAGTNIIGGGVIDPYQMPEGQTSPDEEKKRKLAMTIDSDGSGQHPPTLIDSELETLYSGFQKRRKSKQESDSSLRDLGENPAWGEAEARGRKLRREEAKVRALNSNGRVDYSIQEGAFDISFLASIASHLAYWSDEDVAHFLISQLLSRNRTIKKSKSLGNVRGST